ncbi:MAG: hypothetical protein WBB84_05240 [Candidatus Omnitrophota bacterium]
MAKEHRVIVETGAKARGWDALEIKLKSRGLSIAEVQEARKSFYEGIEVLSKMFLSTYDMEKRENELHK